MIVKGVSLFNDLVVAKLNLDSYSKANERIHSVRRLTGYQKNFRVGLNDYSVVISYFTSEGMQFYNYFVNGFFFRLNLLSSSRNTYFVASNKGKNALGKMGDIIVEDFISKPDFLARDTIEPEGYTNYSLHKLIKMKGPITNISLLSGNSSQVKLGSIINRQGELTIPDLISTPKDFLESNGEYTVIVSGSFPYTLYFFRNKDKTYLGQFDLDSYDMRDISIEYDEPSDKLIVFVAL